MVARMSCKRSNIPMPATRFLAADTPLLRSANSPKRRSMACASVTLVAHPQSAPRTCCMYVLDELASTPLMAILVPTVPHSSVLVCMTASWASHTMPTVVTSWASCKGRGYQRPEPRGRQSAKWSGRQADKPSSEPHKGGGGGQCYSCGQLGH